MAYSNNIKHLARQARNAGLKIGYEGQCKRFDGSLHIVISIGKKAIWACPVDGFGDSDFAEGMGAVKAFRNLMS